MISHDLEWGRISIYVSWFTQEYSCCTYDKYRTVSVTHNVSVFVSVSKQVSKCRFVERNYVTPFHALTLRMSSEHVSPKLFRVNSWILQMIRQWIPDSWSGDRKYTGPKGAAANSRNWQLITSGRLQMLATSNFRDWHTVVGEIPWSTVLKTK